MRRNLVGILSVSVGAALELTAWRFWLAGQLWVGLLLHVLSAAAVGAGGPPRWRRWLALISLCVPATGWAAGAMFLGLGSSPGTALDEFREHTRPDPPPPAYQPRTIEEQLAHSLTTPQTIVSASLDARAARSLAESVPILGDRLKVRQLMELMSNPSEDSYHIAAAKIARLQEYFTLRSYEASQRASAEPQSVAAQMDLGEVYVSYLKSGLLDGPLADFYYRLAVQRFESAAQLEPNNPAWPLRCAELHRRNGRFRLALDVCEELLRRWPDHMETRMRILEIYYYGARLGVDEATRQFYLMLKRLSAEFDASKINDAWLRRAAQWWFADRREDPHA